MAFRRRFRKRSRFRMRRRRHGRGRRRFSRRGSAGRLRIGYRM